MEKKNKLHRIDELEEFYISNEQCLRMGAFEDTKIKKSRSLDAKGQWAIEQFENAASTFLVKKFIIPLSEGGCELPEIDSIEMYLENALAEESESLMHLESVIPMKKSRMDSLMGKCVSINEMRKERELAASANASKPPAKETSSKKGAPVQDEPEQDLEELSQVAMSEWERAEHAYQTVIDKLKSIHASASKEAKNQRENDVDALSRARRSLYALKGLLGQVFKVFPELQEVCRQRKTHQDDPYESCDMRRVFGNMVAKYRKNDEIGVVASLVSFMKEQQAEKTLSQFLRKIEDNHLQLQRAKVVTISIGDLSALVALSGMNEQHRIDFFKKESILALAGVEKDGGGSDSDDADTSSISSSWQKKPLFDKVRHFVEAIEELSDISDKFSKQSKNPPPDRDKNRGDRDRDAEARDVFLLAERDKPDAERPPNICFQYAEHGHCFRGDKCRFKMSHHPKYFKGDCPPAGKKNGPKNPLSVLPPSGHPADVVDKKPGPSTPPRKGANDDLFNLIEKDWFVQVTEEDQVNTLACEDGIDCSLTWDSGTTTSVAGDPRIAVHNPRENTTGKVARGVGGTMKIARVADSSLLGEKDLIIFDGPPNQVPNLLSVSKSARDADKASVFIFMAKGAVRMKLLPADMQLLKEMTQRAVEDKRFQGRANLEQGLYVQHFGEKKESHVSWNDQRNERTLNMSTYSGRYVTDGLDGVIGMLLSSGITASTLRSGAENPSVLKGLPLGLDVAAVDRYMERIGPDQDQLISAIVKSRLTQPPDYVKQTSNIPGEVLEVDNIDPSFSRMLSSEKNKKVVIKSIGGFKDSVLAVDAATGYAQLQGRVSPKQPHLVLERFMKDWISRWRNLKCIKVDKAFVTEASMHIIRDLKLQTGLNFHISQAVPGEHDKGLGMIEGTGRWRQEVAQANMNRAKLHVRSGELTEEEWRTLWFHALQHSVVAGNMKPSKCNPFVSRHEEGTGEVFNLAYYPMRPFATKVVGRKLLSDGDGRGEIGLYLGPSMIVRGGIIFYSFATRRISAKYTFYAREHMPILSDLDIERSTELMYGGLIDVSPTIPQVMQHEDMLHEEMLQEEAVESDADITDDDSSTVVTQQNLVSQLPSQEYASVVASDISLDSNNTVEVPAVSASVGRPSVQITTAVAPTVSATVPTVNATVARVSPFRGGKIGKYKKPFNNTVSEKDPYRREYITTKSGESVNSVDVTKVEKPKLPERKYIRNCDESQEWFKSRRREYKKLVEENSFKSLDKDEYGKIIVPRNSIVMRFLEIYEYKWKEDPDTKTMRWLESTRAVADGSSDKRKESFYAETPSRAVFLLMASIEASMGILSRSADAVRAYLNADSIDDNLVVILPDDVIRMDLGLDKMMGLSKGLYGSRSGALSFEVWYDKKAIIERQFQKCYLAKSVYLKEVNGSIIRMYRHSDDVKMSSANRELLDTECEQLSSLMRMSDWVEPEKFVGCSIEYGDRVVLLRQTDKILETEARFHHFIIHFNPARRVRQTRLPANALDDDLCESKLVLLGDKMASEYRSFVSATNWICTLRMDCKFPQHVVAGRMQTPREWDMYCAMWYLEYLVHTAEYPLVLGGPIIDPQGMSDASFATMPEKRSVKSHLVRTGPSSGAIIASTDTIKIATTSVWDCEVQAASDLVDSLSYVMNLCEDLKFVTDNTRRVQIDSESGLEWYQSNKVNAKSRHLQIKYYHTKHSVQEGVVNMEFIEGENNDSDLNTKILNIARTKKLSRKMLGHCLVLGQNYRGIIELDVGESI